MYAQAPTNPNPKAQHKTTTSMSSQNPRAELPPELVDQILGYCDKRSLPLLSRVNHQFNFFALSRYFAPQIMGDLLQLPSKLSEESLLALWKKPPPMHILQTALWLPRTIRHIDYCLPPSVNSDRYISDLRVLTTFIRKMPKLTSLRINSGQHRTRVWAGDLDCESICNELLAVAISKGCEILEIREGGLNFGDLFHYPKRSLFTSISKLGPWILGTFSRASSPKTDVQSSLQEFQIDGGSFQSWPIFPIILARQADSITRLSLTNLRIFVPKDIVTLFDHIHFPALKSFTFSTYRERIPSTIFLKFISRHLTLVDLDIDGRPPTQPKWLLRWNPPVFPNLRHLGMSPKTLVWLVTDFRQCPKLQSISLKGIDQDSWRFWWGPGEMHGAIRSILRDLHVSPFMVWPLKVEITLPLDDLDWLSRCYTLKDGETQPQCPRVKELRLRDANWYKSNSEYFPNRAHLGVLVDWLSTFPSLERLELASSAPMLGKEFVGMVAARCPKLRSFGHPSKERFHVKLGRKWKMWDVQDGRIESRTVWRLVQS